MRDPIFEEHQHLIGKIRRLIAPRYPDREDLEAEGALILLQAIASYDPNRGAQFPTYAIHQLKGGYQHVIRKSRRQQLPHHCLPQVEQDPAWTGHPEREGAGLEYVLDPDARTEAQALTQVQQEAIHTALAKLPELWRRTVWLRYWVDCTYAQCSTILGRSIPTVRDYELKALERLRGLLADWIPV